MEITPENQEASSNPPGIVNPKLIISSGDISDSDGFYAIAQYAKTGADVIFVMNYPAYIEEKENSGQQEPGLGFKYDVKKLLNQAHTLLGTNASPDNAEAFRQYSNILKTFNTTPNKGDQMKSAMNAIACTILTLIWEEMSTGKNKLYFCTGGVNDINPFNYPDIKNEVYVYAPIFDKTIKLRRVITPRVQDQAQECDGAPELSSGLVVIMPTQTNVFDLLDKRESIYIDFNGSMAFLNNEWCNKICKLQKKIKGAFVLGGVLAYEPPQTMCAINGVLNRLSCATMNQCFAPTKTATFFRLMATCGIPVFVVPNNEVTVLGNRIDPATKKSLVEECREKVQRFLTSNEIYTETVMETASKYYFGKYEPPIKAFDFYSALALTEHMKDPAGFTANTTAMKIHFDDIYGVTMVHNTTKNWRDVINSYESQVKASARYSGDFTATFDNEFSILRKIKTSCIDCNMVGYQTDPTTLKLSIKPRH